MPQETRYLRSDKWNDIYKLLTENTLIFDSESVTIGQYLPTAKVGIKVYADGVRISGDNPVAQVAFEDGDFEVERAAQWIPPPTDLTGKYLKIYVYFFCGTIWEQLIPGMIFRTDVFVSARISALEWTIYYNGTYNSNLLPAPSAVFTFLFGEPALDSRIEKFTWAVPTPPRPSSKILGIKVRKILTGSSAYGVRGYGAFHYGAGADFHGIYRVRVILGKSTQEKMDFYIPANPQTPGQQNWRAKLRAAVIAWLALTDEQKEVYNKKAKYKDYSGYNLYISEFLLS